MFELCLALLETPLLCHSQFALLSFSSPLFFLSTPSYPNRRTPHFPLPAHSIFLSQAFHATISAFNNSPACTFPSRPWPFRSKRLNRRREPICSKNTILNGYIRFPVLCTILSPLPIHTATDNRRQNDFFTLKSRHPKGSGLSAASGCFCAIPPVPRYVRAYFAPNPLESFPSIFF